MWIKTIKVYQIMEERKALSSEISGNELEINHDAKVHM